MIMTLLIASASIILTSCDWDRLLGEVDGQEKPPVIIEPPCEPMFRFDADGIPYRWEMPELTDEMQQKVDEMQQKVKAEVVGYGWKWVQTNEIYASGYVDHEDFYKSMIGMSPSSYYIKSDDELISYFHSDACNEDAYLAREYTFDAKTGTMMSADAGMYLRPWTFYLKIISLYEYFDVRGDGRWYMACVEPLCIRHDAAGESYTVWGLSQYIRMSSSELQQMQRQYDFDYSQVN